LGDEQRGGDEPWRARHRVETEEGGTSRWPRNLSQGYSSESQVSNARHYNARNERQVIRTQIWG
jgi:hypothetical protein